MTDLESQIIYKIPQFNIIAHGADFVNQHVRNGQITNWVSNETYTGFNKHSH